MNYCLFHNVKRTCVFSSNKTLVGNKISITSLQYALNRAYWRYLKPFSTKSKLEKLYLNAFSTIL